MSRFTDEVYITIFNTKFNQDENFSLNKSAVADYALSAFAKSEAERGNSNNLPLANNSTPLTRAFFVRSLRTPKETQRIAIVQALRGSLSMVGRNGQSLRLAALPMVAVFHPVTPYRQAWKLAVDVQKLPLELSKMLFKFLVLGDKRLTISIRAKSEQEARQKLQFTSPALCVARFNTSKGGIYA